MATHWGILMEIQKVMRWGMQKVIQMEMHLVKH
jgi:hypothetical protein